MTMSSTSQITVKQIQKFNTWPWAIVQRKFDTWRIIVKKKLNTWSWIEREHECFFYDNATTILAEAEKLPPKLNFVIIVEGKKEKKQLKQAVRGNGYKQNRRRR